MRIRLLSMALLLSALLVSLASRGATSEPGIVSGALHARAAAQGTVRVIVRLNAPFAPENRLASPAHVMGQRQMLTSAQAMVRTQLRGLRHRVVREFNGRLPLMAIEASPDALQMLASLRGIVADVQEDVAVPPTLAQSVPLIKATNAWDLGYDGTDQIVVILDTGVQKDHDFFAGGKVIAEACFSSNSSGGTSLCPGALEFSADPGSGLPCDVEGCEHGTHVAGIAAGAGVSSSGVAKGASIIAIQVFSRFNDFTHCDSPPCVLSFTSDQIEALNYVHAQRQIFSGQRIAAVNMSLGGSGFDGPCDTQPQKAAIDQLRTPHPTDPTDPGVATVIASGNSFFTDAISAPACISSAIPVASSTKSDLVSSFSNVASPAIFPSLVFAPGSSIMSSIPPAPDTFGSLSGTSMAAPHVAGAMAVLRQAAPTTPVSVLIDKLKAGGKPIHDSRPTCSNGCLTTGSTVPRIDVLAAIQRLVPNLVVQTLTAPAAGIPGANVSVTTSIRNANFGPAGTSNLKLYFATDSVNTSGDQLLGTIAFGSLTGGTTSPVKTLAVQIPLAAAPGSYFIRAVADADALDRDETSETDNTKVVAIQVALPDLAVPTVSFLPAASAPGANISVTHTVRNVALSPANAPASTSGIYLGANQSFGSVVGGRLAIASAPAVAAGATSPAITTTNVNVPGGTPLGRYYVLVRANDTATFVEDTAASNIGASVGTLIVGPDLIVTTATTGTAVAAGGNASVTYTLKNQGGQAAGAFDVAFALIPQAGGPDQPLGPSRTVPSVAAGAATPFTNVLAIPANTAPGSYRIRVIADANTAVPEADEGNNSILTGLLNVVRADLTVASVTFAPLATLPGGNVTVTHTVKNLSPVPATAVGSFSHLYLGANQSVASAAVDFGTVFVPAIPGGATSTVVKGVQIPGNTAPGLYYVVVNADDTGVIFEPNEGNNTGASLTRLIVGPDVLPTVATTGTGVAPGANASVTYTLKNQGGQAANLDVFFDLIPQPSGSPISIGPSRTISGFAAGATTAFTNAVLVPSGTAPGSYKIRVTASPSVDADPSNNAIVTGVVNIVRPDLTVLPVTFAPAASFPGGNVTVTHTVKNVAVAPGNAGASLSRLLLAQNQSAISPVADFGTVSFPSIAAGGMATVSRGVSIPGNTSPGLYYLVAVADDPGSILEYNELNNVGASASPIIIGPDLLGTAATTLAATAPGANLSVTYTLKNQGGAAAGPFGVGFAIVPVNASGTPIGGDVALSPGRTGITLPAGGSMTFTNSFLVPSFASGLHRIRVIVDPADAVVEANESNNSLLTAGTLNVIRPDLIVPPFTFSPLVSAPGGAVTVMYSIKNQAPAPGNAATSASRLFLSVNRSVLGTVADLGTVGVPPVAAGMTVSGSRFVTLPGGLAPGLYYFGTEADPTGLVAESNESNNVTFTQARIIVGADLVPTVVTATPAAIAPGFNVSVTSTIKNQGGAATGPFDVGFYLSTDNVFGGDTLLATRAISSLVPGAVSTITTPVPIPGNLSAGTYFLIVRADDGGVLTEADGTNNTRATAAIQVVRPDLSTQTVTATPTATAPGANVSVTQTIKNLSPAAGGAAATTSRLYLSDSSAFDVTGKPVLGDVAVPALAGGATSTLTRSVQIPPGTAPGKYWIFVQANALGSIEEVGTANDLQRTANPIIVGADLAVTALTTTTTLASPNFTFPVTTTVKNQGGQGSSASAVRFFLNSVNSLSGSPIPLGVTATATVAPGASVTTTTRLTIPSNTSVGSYFVLAQADGDAQVTEADESNNVRAAASPINVQLPDLKIISVNPPAASIRGKITGAPLGTVVVKNIGLGPSAPFNVQVFANRDEGDGSGSDAPGLGDTIFTRTVPLLAPGAQTTVTGPIIVPETVASVVRLAGNYYMSAVADPTGTATRDPSTGDNVLTRTTKKIPVLPDMTKLQTASVDLTLQPDCGFTTLNLEGPFSVTNQTLANPSNFAGTVVLTDTLGSGFVQRYNVTGTVQAVDVVGTAGKILSSFTYTATIANDFASNGSGTINGAAPALNFTGGSITGQQAKLPSCTFAGSIDIVR